MNYYVILRSIGMLLLLLCASMLVCLGGALMMHHEVVGSLPIDFDGWWEAIGLTAGTGALMHVLGRVGLKRQGAKFRVSRREAIAVVGLGWLMITAFAALPHYLALEGIPYSKAVFEASSGLTTTGSTIFEEIAHLPKTTLLWRSMTQFMGGMGILGAFLLIFSGETKGKTLLSFESSISGTDLSSTNLRNAMRNLWVIYTGLTLICAVGLMLSDMTLFQALNHAMCATSTGGFGTENDSVSSFCDATKLWLTLIMFLSGFSFPIYIVMLERKNFDILKRHEETRWYTGVVLLTTAVIYGSFLIGGYEFGFIEVIFNVVSIITSTGFGVGDFVTWPMIGQQCILFLMILGGCSGSTAGGLKVSRVVLWLKSLRNELIKGFRPSVMLRLKMNKRQVETDIEKSAYVIISLAFLSFLVGSLWICTMDPQLSLSAACTSVLTAMFNSGPGFAEVGPTSNFSSLSSPSLWLMSLLMILGRLEFVAVFALFSRRLWRRY